MFEATFIPVAIATIVALYIAVIDFRELRIPNRILLPGLVISILAMVLTAISSSDFGSLLRALAGALISTAIFLAIHLLNPKGLGMGDVKFAALIGLTLSWISFPLGLIGLAISWLAASIFSIFTLLAQGRNFNRLIPFGPFMLFGLLFVEFGLLI